MLLAIVRRLSKPALTDLVTFDIRVSVGRTLEELLLPDAATRVWANGPVTHLSFCLGPWDVPNLQGYFELSFDERSSVEVVYLQQ